MTLQPPGQVQPLTLWDYLEILWRRRWLVLIPLLVTPLVAFLVTSWQPTRYEGRATLLLRWDDPVAQLLGMQEASFISPRLKTQADVVRSYEVLRRALPEATPKGMEGTEPGAVIETIRKRLSVKVDRDSTLMRIRYTAEDPLEALEVTEAVVRAYQEYVREQQQAVLQAALQTAQAFLEREGEKADLTAEQRLSQQLLQLQLALETVRSSGTFFNITVVDPPSVVAVPPRRLLNTLVGLLMGAVLGGGAAFLAEYLDRRIHNEADVQRLSDLPILASVPLAPHVNGTVPFPESPRSPFAESFRLLRANLRFSSVDVPLKRILITSPEPSTGKTTVALNLARALAADGRRVLVIDADLRRPFVHRALGVPKEPGLTNYLAGSLEAPPVLVLRGEEGSEDLHILASGPTPPNPVELLASRRMADLLEDLSGQFDTLLLDAAPCLGFADVLSLAPHCTGVLLVVQAELTERDALRQAIEQLERARARILGIVFNGAPTGGGRYGYYGYYRYYRYYREYAEAEPGGEG